MRKIRIVSQIVGVKSISINSANLMIVHKKKIIVNDCVVFTSVEECFGEFISSSWFSIADRDHFEIMSLDGVAHQIPIGYSPLWQTFDEDKLTIITSFNGRMLDAYQYRAYDFGLLDICEKRITSLKLVYPQPWPTNKRYMPFPVGKQFIDLYDVTTKKNVPVTLPENTGRWYNTFDKKWIEGAIWHVVDIINEILWIDIQKGVLVGIDVQTGEVRQQLQTPVQMNQAPGYLHWELPQFAHTTYEAARHQLVGMFSDRYYQVDLRAEKPTLDMWVLEEEFRRHNIALRNAERRAITDTHIYFLDSHIPQMGALNRQSLTLDWVYKFDDNTCTGVPMQVEAIATNLYVLEVV